MKNFGNTIRLLVAALMLAVIMIAPAGNLWAQTQPTPTPSAASSPDSVTPAATDQGLRQACAEAVEELKAARKLIKAQGDQIEQGDKLAALQLDIEAGLRNINSLSAEEKDSLRAALNAKDKQIAALNAQLNTLKKKGGGWWGKFKIAAVAVAVGIIAGKVL